MAPLFSSSIVYSEYIASFVEVLFPTSSSTYMD